MSESSLRFHDSKEHPRGKYASGKDTLMPARGAFKLSCQRRAARALTEACQLASRCQAAENFTSESVRSSLRPSAGAHAPLSERAPGNCRGTVPRRGCCNQLASE